MSRREGFLDRWSRLKEAGEVPETKLPEAVEPSETEADDRSDEEILADLGLPHPDDLQPGDDITAFMAKAVPERMRRIALRQLWRGNPVLANLDGLVEYGEDYTDSAMVVENLQTLYQVGKGMFVENEEPDEVTADESEEGATPEELDDEATNDFLSETIEADDSDESPLEVAPAEQPAFIETADATPQPTRRRMTFS